VLPVERQLHTAVRDILDSHQHTAHAHSLAGRTPSTVKRSCLHSCAPRLHPDGNTHLLHATTDLLDPLNVFHLHPGHLLGDDLFPEHRLLADYLRDLYLGHHDTDLLLQELRHLHLPLHDLCLDAWDGLLPVLDDRTGDLCDTLDDLHFWDLHWPLLLDEDWDLDNLLDRFNIELGDLLLHWLVNVIRPVCDHLDDHSLRNFHYPLLLEHGGLVDNFL